MLKKSNNNKKKVKFCSWHSSVALSSLFMAGVPEPLPSMFYVLHAQVSLCTHVRELQRFSLIFLGNNLTANFCVRGVEDNKGKRRKIDVIINNFNIYIYENKAK